MRNNVTGKIAWWVRLLAVMLLSLQLFMAYHFATALIRQQTTLSSLFTDSLPDTLIMLFLNVLFAFVALTGRSPLTDSSQLPVSICGNSCAGATKPCPPSIS